LSELQFSHAELSVEAHGADIIASMSDKDGECFNLIMSRVEAEQFIGELRGVLGKARMNEARSLSAPNAETIQR